MTKSQLNSGLWRYAHLSRLFCVSSSRSIRPTRELYYRHRASSVGPSKSRDLIEAGDTAYYK